MLAIQLASDILIPLGCLLFGLMAGYLFRGAQIKSLHYKVIELERDLMQAHAEILDTQKDKVALQQKLKEFSPIPVIPIKAASEEKAVQKSADKHS